MLLRKINFIFLPVPYCINLSKIKVLDITSNYSSDFNHAEPQTMGFCRKQQVLDTKSLFHSVIERTFFFFFFFFFNDFFILLCTSLYNSKNKICKIFFLIFLIIKKFLFISFLFLFISFLFLFFMTFFRFFTKIIY